jgi:hypothetical protein
MPDQPTPANHARLTLAEKELLYCLADDPDGQQLWQLTDLSRQIDDSEDALIAANGLLAAGLAYRTEDAFLFASRAGVRAVAMIGAVI